MTSRRVTTSQHVKKAGSHTFAVAEIGCWPEGPPDVRQDDGGLVVTLIGKADIVVVAGGMALVS